MRIRNVFFSFLCFALLCFVLAAFIFIGCTTNPSANKENPSITIVNKTGFTVWHIYISPASYIYWGADWLEPAQVIMNGQSVTLPLKLSLKMENLYDIRLRDSDGDDYIKRNVSIKNNSTIEFTFIDVDLERLSNRLGNKRD
ncbi:MAG: hypothetical protein LBU88_07720 [Treponema sp.]|nr:hypothetical protein [Treponema sp.]